MNTQLPENKPSEGIVEGATDKSVSENPTELVKFNPLPSMLLWIDTAIDIVSDSPTEIAEKCGIDRTTWYDWLKKPGFEDWYYDEYKRRRKRWLPTLDKIGMANAKREYNYWKDMNKKVGDDVEQPSTSIQLNNLIKIE